MSRIGLQVIDLPSNVTLEMLANNMAKIKGPKGELDCKIDKNIKIHQTDSEISLSLINSEKRDAKAMHGLYRSLINNMVIGVSKGYKKSLELVGVGYKAATVSNYLELNLGFSHSILFVYPNDVTIKAETVKGKNPIIHIEGIDKQFVGQIAAKIRSFRRPEPYKGKGIRFVGEIIRRKAGKTAGK